MSANENDSKFLIFTVGGEQYGSPLLTIREVLQYQKPNPMPNMVPSFAGVINVRGSIVGVVDLRQKFSVQAQLNERTAMLLCDTDRGSIAAIVDRVESVLELPESDLDRKPAVKAKVDQNYLLGIAKVSEKLITLIDLHKSLTDEEYRAA